MQGDNEQQPDNSTSFAYEPQSANDQGQASLTESMPPPETNASADEPVVTWEASEYIHHDKGASWYIGFTGVMLVLVVAVYLLIGELFSVMVMVLMGVAVAVYAGRKPDTVRYSLSRTGIAIGGKHYNLDEFSSFTIMQEGGVYSVTLMPTKRFMPPVSIYFSADDGEKITDVLGEILPHEDREPDLIDRLMRNIRF